jgi:hypothetical protein
MAANVGASHYANPMGNIFQKYVFFWLGDLSRVFLLTRLFLVPCVSKLLRLYHVLAATLLHLH